MVDDPESGPSPELNPFAALLPRQFVGEYSTYLSERMPNREVCITSVREHDDVTHLRYYHPRAVIALVSTLRAMLAGVRGVQRPLSRAHRNQWTYWDRTVGPAFDGTYRVTCTEHGGIGPVVIVDRECQGKEERVAAGSLLDATAFCNALQSAMPPSAD